MIAISDGDVAAIRSGLSAKHSKRRFDHRLISPVVCLRPHKRITRVLKEPTHAVRCLLHRVLRMVCRQQGIIRAANWQAIVRGTEDQPALGWGLPSALPGAEVIQHPFLSDRSRARGHGDENYESCDERNRGAENRNPGRTMAGQIRLPSMETIEV